MPANVSNRRSSVHLVLDVDGVINKEYNEQRTYDIVQHLFPDYKTVKHNYICSKVASQFFNENAINNLSQIIETIKEFATPKIVVSSNWRKTCTVRQLRKIFEKHHFSQYIVDKTPELGSRQIQRNKKLKRLKHKIKGSRHNLVPDLPKPPTRAEEIKKWLDTRQKDTIFVILDDNNDGLSEKFGEKFIQTKFEDLITPEVVDKVLNEVNNQIKFQQLDKIVHKVRQLISKGEIDNNVFENLRKQADTSDEDVSPSPRD